MNSGQWNRNAGRHPAATRRRVAVRVAGICRVRPLGSIWPHSANTSPLNNQCISLLILALLLPTFGCNSFSNGKLVQQLQSENERLLTEFRAERQRREESERVNRTLEARLSESEKLLARQTPGAAPNRLSSLQPGYQLPVNSSSNPAAGNRAAEATAGGNSADFRWQRRVN